VQLRFNCRDEAPTASFRTEAFYPDFASSASKNSVHRDLCTETLCLAFGETPSAHRDRTCCTPSLLNAASAFDAPEPLGRVCVLAARFPIVLVFYQELDLPTKVVLVGYDLKISAKRNPFFDLNHRSSQRR
jgi:hypothetical protein